MYCNQECQRQHWNSGHKEECNARKKKKADLPISYMDYHQYLSWMETKQPVSSLRDQMLLGSWREQENIRHLATEIGYGLNHQFFRMRDFLHALVAANEDTDENMEMLFGYRSTGEHFFNKELVTTSKISEITFSL